MNRQRRRFRTRRPRLTLSVMSFRPLQPRLSTLHSKPSRREKKLGLRQDQQPMYCIRARNRAIAATPVVSGHQISGAMHPLPTPQGAASLPVLQAPELTGRTRYPEHLLARSLFRQKRRYKGPALQAGLHAFLIEEAHKSPVPRVTARWLSSS